MTCWCILLCVLIGCGLWAGSVRAEKTEKGHRLVTDSRGTFFLWQDDSGGSITVFREGQRQQELNTQGTRVEDLLINGDDVRIAFRSGDLLCLFDPSDAAQTSWLLKNVHPKEHGLAITDHEVCLVEEKQEKQIVCYRSFGSSYSIVETESRVIALFSSPCSREVFAVTDSGILSPETNCLIPCDVPVFPVRINKGGCVDAEGTVFSFDETAGFVRQGTALGDKACFRNGFVYVVRNLSVLQTDVDGRILAECFVGKPIEDAAASGDSLAVLSEGRLLFLQDEDFVKVSEASEEQHSFVTEEASNAEKTSQEKEPAEKNTGKWTVGIGTLEGNTITGLPLDTTVAAFRKSCFLQEGSLVFWNHHGQEVTGGSIGTGWQIEYAVPGQETQIVSCIVKGDVTGEGNPNKKDMVLLAQFMVGSCQLTQIQQQAGDVTGDGKIDLQDLVRMQKCRAMSPQKLPPDVFL